MQVNKFINSVLIYIRDIYLNYPNIMKYCIEDSRIIIEMSCKESQKLTFFMYNTHEYTYLDMSNILFQKMIMKDKAIQTYLKEKTTPEKIEAIESVIKIKENELTDENIINTQKKKNKKKKKKEIIDNYQELDKEIEEFKSKLELENAPYYKIKPNLSADWIAGLRKRLKKSL